MGNCGSQPSIEHNFADLQQQYAPYQGNAQQEVYPYQAGQHQQPGPAQYGGGRLYSAANGQMPYGQYGDGFDSPSAPVIPFNPVRSPPPPQEGLNSIRGDGKIGRKLGELLVISYDLGTTACECDECRSS